MKEILAVFLAFICLLVFIGLYVLLAGPETFIDNLKKRRLKEQQWREKMAERKRLKHLKRLQNSRTIR